MEANAGKSFQMQIIFNIFPRISLHCKLVPVQYWEYEYGLLEFGNFDEKGKPDNREENLTEQSKKINNQLNPLVATSPKSNLGHVGGRQMLSPLRHPC